MHLEFLNTQTWSSGPATARGWTVTVHLLHGKWNTDLPWGLDWAQAGRLRPAVCRQAFLARLRRIHAHGRCVTPRARAHRRCCRGSFGSAASVRGPATARDCNRRCWPLRSGRRRGRAWRPARIRRASPLVDDSQESAARLQLQVFHLYSEYALND